MEISPSGACNHRCKFCALDFMGYQQRYLDVDILTNFMADAYNHGLKSVMLGGEGEPLLHKWITDITKNLHDIGLDVACTSNGALLTKWKAERMLPYLSWLKVSVDAGTEMTYREVHGTKPTQFKIVLNNMTFAADLRAKHGYECSLGMQALLLPENESEMMLLASMAKDIGMDYVVIKPYSQHKSSDTRLYKDVEYGKYDEMQEELSQLDDDNFKVVFRSRAMQTWDEGKLSLNTCYALPFWAYLDAGGNLWGCSAYLGHDEWNWGRYTEKFLDIWFGDKRRDCVDTLDIQQCRVGCRMSRCNEYLYNLKYPGAHANFI